MVIQDNHEEGNAVLSRPRKAILKKAAKAIRPTFVRTEIRRRSGALPY